LSNVDSCSEDGIQGSTITAIASSCEQATSGQATSGES